MAADAEVRRQPAPVRAAVARAAAQVLAGQRWLAFAAGMEATYVGLPPGRRAALLVIVHDWTSGSIDGGEARRRLAAVGCPAVDPEVLASAEARCAAMDDATRRLAVRQSLPDWLAEAFVSCHGDGAESLLQALCAAPRRTVRANLLRVPSRDHLATSLRDLGIECDAGAFSPWALHVRGERDVFDTEAYRSGAYEQQDEASQLAALAVAPPPRGRVLDLCAGSGGKTLAVAAMLQNKGQVLATDVSERRLAALRPRLVRAGVDNVQVAAIAEAAVPSHVEHFAACADRILVDAPCSGSGSWRRRPEARWALAPGDLEHLMRTQDALLDRASRWLRPRARLIYATCSVLRCENEARVDALLERHPELERVRLAEVLGGATASPIADDRGTCLSLRPDRHGTDGFFAAILRRRAD